jgi:hypothetical protein
MCQTIRWVQRCAVKCRHERWTQFIRFASNCNAGEAWWQLRMGYEPSKGRKWRQDFSAAIISYQEEIMTAPEDPRTMHPDMDLVRQYALGCLAGQLAAKLEEHLSWCEECCRVLEKIPGGSFVESLRQACTQGEPASGAADARDRAAHRCLWSGRDPP